MKYWSLSGFKFLTYYNPFTFSKALCLTLYQQHFMHRQVASINTLNIANVSWLSLPGRTLGWDYFKGKLVFCLENCSDLLYGKNGLVDWENFFKGREFIECLRSLEQFIPTGNWSDYFLNLLLEVIHKKTN